MLYLWVKNERWEIRRFLGGRMLCFDSVGGHWLFLIRKVIWSNMCFKKNKNHVLWSCGELKWSMTELRESRFSTEIIGTNSRLVASTSQWDESPSVYWFMSQDQSWERKFSFLWRVRIQFCMVTFKDCHRIWIRLLKEVRDAKLENAISVNVQLKQTANHLSSSQGF